MSNDTEVLEAMAGTAALHNRKSFGLYVGAVSQPAFSWDKCIGEISGSHFNAISVHLLSPWSNYDGFYPWTFDHAAHKYDLRSGHLNQAWLDHQEAMLTACWRVRPTPPVSPEFAMGDAYFTHQWQSSFPQYGSIYHPFRNNNIGLDWSASANPFYDAFGRGINKNAWLTWEAGDKGPYKINGAIGHALETYYRGVASVVAKVQKQFPVRSKAAPLLIRCLHECTARIMPDGEIDYSRSLGGYDQIGWWAKGIFEAEGASVQMVSDWFPTRDGRTLDVSNAVKAQKGLRSWNFLYEIHGCDAGIEVAGYLNAGLRKDTCLFSSDGSKEDASYPHRMASIASLGVSFDFKLADYFSPHRYRNRDIDASFHAIFPDQQKDIFGP